MNFYKKIRSGLKLLGCRFFGLRIPLAIQFEITSRCTADCVYCGFEGGREEFSTQEALSLISEMSDLGTEKLIFTGGEPLLREDISSLVEKAKDEGLMVNLNSNGFLVPEKIDEIRDVDFLVLSLDGPRHIHNSLRGRNSFENVTEAIKIAKRNGLDVLLNSVLTKKNIEEVNWLMKKAYEWKTPISFQPVVGEFYGSREGEKLKPGTDQLQEAIKKIQKFKTIHKNLVRPSHPTLQLVLKQHTSNLFERLDCGRGTIACRIEGRKLTACGRYKSSEVLIEDDFKSAWQSLTPPKNCSNTCCTGSIELSEVWNLKPDVILNQLMNNSF